MLDGMHPLYNIEDNYLKLNNFNKISYKLQVHILYLLILLKIEEDVELAKYKSKKLKPKLLGRDNNHNLY
jgi:hypothetical protein